MIKLSIRLPIPGLHNRLRETFIVANLKTEENQPTGYLRFSKTGEIGYRLENESEYNYAHPEWLDYTGNVWAMSQEQQYMFKVVNGVLSTVSAMNGLEDIRRYLKHVRIAQTHALSLSQYLGVQAALLHRITTIPRRTRRVDSDWQQVFYLRCKHKLTLPAAKAFVKAEADTGLNLPTPISDIVHYAR